jgi:DNA ligase 1
MKEIRVIIDSLVNTSSLKEKETLLKQHEKNDQLFMLLQMHSNPYRQFYVAKFPTIRPEAETVSLGGGTNFDKFLHLCGLLTSRTLSGHAALATIYDFFQTCNEDEHWIFEKILFKEKLNFGASLINKVRPKWIPEFDCMLADAKQPKLDEITYPVCVQPKLDGFRAVFHPTSKGFIGRNGKPVRNETLNSYFKDLIDINKTWVLDGELYSHELEFNQIASILGSEDKTIPNSLYYCVYDIMNITEWNDQRCDKPYNYRLENIQTNVSKRWWSLKNVKPIDFIIASDEKDLSDYYKNKLTEGFEGVMVKSLQGLYQWKRVSVKSQIMMKIKPHDEYDGKVVGFEEGEGQHKNMLGALVLQIDNIRNPVKVGSGFSENLRKELWQNPQKLVGQWVKLKAFEITENNESLRFPIFLSFRDSKD